MGVRSGGDAVRKKQRFSLSERRKIRPVLVICRSFISFPAPLQFYQRVKGWRPRNMEERRGKRKHQRFVPSFISLFFSGVRVCDLLRFPLRIIDVSVFFFSFRLAFQHPRKTCTAQFHLFPRVRSSSTLVALTFFFLFSSCLPHTRLCASTFVILFVSWLCAHTFFYFIFLAPFEPTSA